MKYELKVKWLEALRSGKYQQTTGELRGGDKFCCLGVLCDVAKPGAWKGESWTWITNERTESSADSCLPLSFRFSHAHISEDEEQTLIRMNDEERASFAAIADWIDVNL
jgi:hypothetical protein